MNASRIQYRRAFLNREDHELSIAMLLPSSFVHTLIEMSGSSLFRDALPCWIQDTFMNYEF